MVSAVCFVSLIATGDAFAQEVSVFRESIAEIANSFFGWLADSVARPLFGMARTLFLASFKFTIIEFGGYWEGKGNLVGLGPIWTMFRDIVNVLIVLLFIISSVITVLGESTFSVNRSKTLIMLIAAAVFVNFSGFIAFLLIDLSHVLLVVFADQIFNPSALVQLDVFAEEMKIMLGLSGARGDELSLMFSMSRLINYVFLMFSFIAFSLVLLERFLIAIFLILLSPIASLGLFVKQTGLGKIGLGSFFTKAFDAWWKKFSQIVFTPIVLLIGITVVMSIYQRVYDSVLPAGGGTNVSGIGDSSADSLGFLIATLIANVILVYGFLKLYKIAKSEKWYTGAGLGGRVVQRSTNMAKGLLKTGVRGSWDAGMRRYNEYAEKKGRPKAGEGKFVSGAKYASRGLRSLWKGQSWQVAQKDGETEKRRADLEKRAREIIKSHEDNNKYPNFKMKDADEKNVREALKRLENAKGSGGRSMQNAISGAADTIEKQERGFKNMYPGGGSDDDEPDNNDSNNNGPDNNKSDDDKSDDDKSDDDKSDDDKSDDDKSDDDKSDDDKSDDDKSGGGGSGSGGSGDNKPGNDGPSDDSETEKRRADLEKRAGEVIKKHEDDDKYPDFKMARPEEDRVWSALIQLKDAKGSGDGPIQGAISGTVGTIKEQEQKFESRYGDAVPSRSEEESGDNESAQPLTAEDQRERLTDRLKDIWGNLHGQEQEKVGEIIEELNGVKNSDAAAIKAAVDKAEPALKKYVDERVIENEKERLMNQLEDILGKLDGDGREEVEGIIKGLKNVQNSDAAAIEGEIDKAMPVFKKYENELRDIENERERLMNQLEDILDNLGDEGKEKEWEEVAGIIEKLDGAQNSDAAAIKGATDEAMQVFEKYQDELDIESERKRFMNRLKDMQDNLDEKEREEVEGIIKGLKGAQNSDTAAIQKMIEEAVPVLKKYQDERDIKNEVERLTDQLKDIWGKLDKGGQVEVDKIIEGLDKAQDDDAAAIQKMIDKAMPVLEKYENELRDIKNERERLTDQLKDILGMVTGEKRIEVEGIIEGLEGAKNSNVAAINDAIEDAKPVFGKYENELRDIKNIKNKRERLMNWSRDILGSLSGGERVEVEGIIGKLDEAQDDDAAAIQKVIDKAMPVLEKYQNELQDVKNERERLLNQLEDILGMVTGEERVEVEGIINELENVQNFDAAAIKAAVDKANPVFVKKYRDEWELYKALENGVRRGKFSSFVNRFFRKGKKGNDR